MKKIVFAVLFTTAASFLAMASDTDMLIWNIDLWDSWVYQPQIENETFPGFNRITFGLQNGTDASSFIDLESNTRYLEQQATTLSGTVGYGPGLAYANDGIAGYYATDLTDYGNDVYGGYEVLIQLWNNDTLIAVSDNIFDSSKHLYLADLARTTMGSDKLPVSAYDVGIQFGSRLVPEPTSGLLMMLGAGLLALRRRRRA